MQFAGPQGVADGMFPPAYFSADLIGWTRLSALTVFGSPEAVRLTTGPAEFTTFLGWPLLLVAAACVVWLGRRAPVVALVAGALTMAALALGPQVVAGGERTGIPGPYALLAGLPVVDGALPMRFALAVLPLVGTVLTLAVHRALAEPGRARRLVPFAAGAALLSVFPRRCPRWTGRHCPSSSPAATGRSAYAPAGCWCRCPPPPRRIPGRCAGHRHRRRVRHAGGLLHRPVRPARHGHHGHLAASHLGAARRRGPPGRGARDR
ncbi:hypothetical protein V2I01_19635 [Micromonospora sp. BRA006-A]|nr:hypothetical protein [Micromonospora sp. BRA006-A]